MTLARGVLAATVGLVSAVAVPGMATAQAECVRVVVDYGTSAGAGTHCTSASGTAAEVLAQRASELGRPRPRYDGNFLCAIDGYPESGCGNSGDKPYWSFWQWVDGKWVYSSLGVDSYTVRDADRDGHPDPIGFRYHELNAKQPPRANPSYPRATTAPPRTAPPPRATPTSPSTRPGTTAPAARPSAGTATATTAAETGEPATPGTPTGNATAAPSATATSTTAPGATATAGTPSETVEPPLAAPPSSGRNGGGLPVGTVVAALLAAVLLGAAGLKLRGSP